MPLLYVPAPSVATSVSSVPDLYPGVLSEEERVRVQRQRAMYRRLFMDIEREAVKEQIKRKEQRNKINKSVKKTKCKQISVKQKWDQVSANKNVNKSV